MNRKDEIFLIVKKELLKFFGNTKLLFATIVLPGLVIYVLYNVLGMIMERQENDLNFLKSTIEVVNMPDDLRDVFDEAGIISKEVEHASVDDIKQKITNDKEILLIVFPEGFDIEDARKAGTCPNIEIYYNASATESLNYYSYVKEVLTSYEDKISNIFDINAGDKRYNLATEKKSMARTIAMVLPTLLMGLIFSACMPIAAESIAGEKEHGTIATLLVTPVKRHNLAMGKIISLSIMALGGAISSYVGTIFSLPRFLKTSGTALISVYGVKEYVALFLTILSVIIVMVSVMSLVSACSKSIKEASTILSPFAAVVMLLGMICMIQKNVMTERWVYLIPLFNNIQEIYNILNFENSSLNFALMFGSNLLYAGVCVAVLSLLFKNEKIIMA